MVPGADKLAPVIGDELLEGISQVPSAFRNFPEAAVPAAGAGTRPEAPPEPLSPVKPPVFGKLTKPAGVATMALLKVLPSDEVEIVKLSFPSNPNCARVLKLSWKLNAAVFDDAPFEIVVRISPALENRTEGAFTESALLASVVPIPSRATSSIFWLARAAGMDGIEGLLDKSAYEPVVATVASPSIFSARALSRTPAAVEVAAGMVTPDPLEEPIKTEFAVSEAVRLVTEEADP